MTDRRGALSWFRANPFFAFLCAAELLFLLLLCCRLPKAAVVFDVPLADFLAYSSENAELSPTEELVLFDPGQTGKETGLISDFYSFPAGAYVMSVAYESVSDPDAPSHSLNDSAGTLTARSFSNQAALTVSELPLCDGRATADVRFWVRPGSRIRDFQLCLNDTGTGRLAVGSIVIREQVIWRWMSLAGWLLLFAVLDLLYCLLFAKGCGGLLALARRYRYEGALALVVVAASLPLFGSGLYYGHDQTFHLCRIGALAAELANGQVPARMLTAMLNGYGYAAPLFYCDLFLYLPALLYNGMLPLEDCYRVYAVLTNLFTCAAAYLSFRGMSGSKTVGVTCAALYTLSVYRLTNLYIRCAVGEYTAMAFFPLIAWGLWNVYQQADGEKLAFRDYAPLTVGLAGVALCHVLSLELCAVFVLGVCLCCLRKTLQPKRLLALLKAAGLALGLCLWFLYPLLESVTGMQIWSNSPYLITKLQSGGLYLAQLFSLFPTATGGNAYAGTEGEMPLSLGLPLIVCLPLILWLFLRRDRRELGEDGRFRLLRGGFAVGMLAALLTLRAFPWDSAENWLGQTAQRYLGMVQFSWRYLSIATVALVTAAAAALALLQKQCGKAVWRWVLPVAAGCLALSAGLFFSQFLFHTGMRSYPDYGVMAQGIQASVASGEYLLSDSDPLLIDDTRPLSDSDQLRISDCRREGGVFYATCENDGAEARATLPVFAYDHYRAYDQAGAEWPVETGENQRVAVVVPQGYHGQLSLRYAPPASWRVCEGVSAATLLLCCFLLWRSRKKARSAQAARRRFERLGSNEFPYSDPTN